MWEGADHCGLGHLWEGGLHERKAELAMKDKAVSSIPLKPVLRFLPPVSYLELLP